MTTTKPDSEFKINKPKLDDFEQSEYYFDRNEKRIRINLRGSTYSASIEDFGEVMSKVITYLRRIREVRSFVLAKDREYEYTTYQTHLLKEIAEVLEFIKRKKLINPSQLELPECGRHTPERVAFMQDFVVNKLQADPIGAYVRLKRYIEEMNVLENKEHGIANRCYHKYISTVLEPIKLELEKTELIQKVKDQLPGYHIGNRALYRQIFHPTIRPNFMLTRYQASLPENGNEIDHYDIPIVNAEVRIFKVLGDIRLHYHITPPEFNLNEEEYAVLDTARRYMSEHEPTESEFADPERTREIFFNIGKDMILDILASMELELSEEKIEQLAIILTRYTAGLGILEILLADPNLQDLYVNSPVGNIPIYVIHGKYGDCITNLIPTADDAESWATRFRMSSGRPLDEANPVLDTEAEVPGGRARVAIISKNLSPEGLAFAFRRHREKPWTFPLFIKQNMLTPLASGLLSFIIDGARTMLIAGTRSAGKTSVLSACLTELMKKYRICTVEDSVTGDSNILYRVNSQFKRTTMSELIDPLIASENKRTKDNLEKDNLEVVTNLSEKIEVYSIDEFGKLHISPVSAVSRHKVKKKIYEIETRTGRKIKVTEDHSLFSLNNSAQICPIPTKRLKVGNYIATPRTLEFSQKNLNFLNLTHYADKLTGYFVSKNISKYVQENRKKILKLAKNYNYSYSTVSSWARNGILPAPLFKELDLKNKIPLESLKYKEGGHSKEIDYKLDLTDDLLSFMGMWLATGRYDKRSVIISIDDKEVVKIITKISKLFGCVLKKHSDGFSYVFNSKTAKEIMVSVLGLTGNSHTKRIPDVIYTLSENQLGAFLKGLFSGTGYATKYEVGIDLISTKLISDIQTLLLGFEIISYIRHASGKGKFSYNTSQNMASLRISEIKFLKEFRKKINFVQNYKKELLEKLCDKSTIHDNTDIIPISPDFKKRLSVLCSSLNKHEYITRKNNIDRKKLAKIIEEISPRNTKLILTSKALAESDVFWDQIKSISEIEHDGKYVYDLSVPQNESFICENILAHNTLEIPVSSLRELGYNIERMKSRSVITQVESELSADDAIRTALRLGDSVLIIGEVRSLEAKSLYEAMRIGALANFVAGTIHGDSAYGVFDRVVNDLGVPPTSFKATDIVVVANTLRSPDGLHTFRRITNIVEVRKEWSEDPLKEHAFVDLMIYDAQKDELVPTDTLLNGESFVLNGIANKIREWKNDWNAIWNNILLRAKIKETLVKYSDKFKKPEILEAQFTVKSNEKFHELSEFVKQEQGFMDSKKIFSLWMSWLKKELKLQNIKADDSLL